MFLPLIFCLCLTLSVGLPQQKDSRNGIGSRIIGGQTAFAGQFPFLAALNIHTSDGLYFCGGALLTTSWLATSGHCLDGAILINVQLGSNSLDPNDSNLLKLTTDSYLIHPEYDPLTLANDIGLVEFRLPITYTDYIKPINMLPGAPLSDRSPLITMGWGQISDEDAGLQNRIQYVSVVTLPNAECKLVYGNQIFDTMVCAEGNYNEGTCYGDTGGPLIQYVSRGQVMLVAISSFISQNGCESTDPSGYTRTFDYTAWIRNNTGFV
ncbi:brachyurin-like [Zophobas morio]|uniref:brachyurin-like n=1 Tax=Zophobas morio TaxID=2755281 RepID=UPI00308363E8